MARVVLCSQNLPVPQDPRVWREARALAGNGHDVTVVAPRGRGMRFREMLEGVRLLRYPAPRALRGVAGQAVETVNALAWTSLLALALRVRGRVDGLHAANPPDTFWAVAMPYRLFGKRYVFDHHDLCPELYVARFGPEREGNLVHRALRWLEWAQFRTADLVISTNESYRQVALTRGRMPPDRVVVVRSGPSRERFATVRAVDPALKRGRPFLVAYLGVMAPQDGVDHLLRAAHHLVRSGRNDIAFTLMGAGDSFDDLRAMARELGLEDQVRFTGRIPDADVEVTLATADVCVCPDPLNPLNDVSTMNKVLEYMACGRPIVAYDLREHRFSAADGALYARPNHDEALADKIRELLDDPAARARIGEYNRKRFLERMAWEHNVGDLVRAYERLCPATHA